MGRPPRPARCPKHQREALGPLALRQDARVRLGLWLPPRAPGTGDRLQRRAPVGGRPGVLSTAGRGRDPHSSVLSSVRGLVLSATGDLGTGETGAPAIVIPPGNRSVVAGSSEVTLECIANAR